MYLHIVLPEASWYHAPPVGARGWLFAGCQAQARDGRYVLAEDYLRARHARTVLTKAVDKALEGLDALMLPALAIGAPPIGAGSAVTVRGNSEPVRAMMLRLTQLFNITGHPAIAMPCGAGADGLPRDPARGASRRHRTAARCRRDRRASDNGGDGSARRRGVNIRAGLVRRFAGRDGMIHDVAGFMHEVGRLRCVRLRRLFDRAE